MSVCDVSVSKITAIVASRFKGRRQRPQRPVPLRGLIRRSRFRFVVSDHFIKPSDAMPAGVHGAVHDGKWRPCSTSESVTRRRRRLSGADVQLTNGKLSRRAETGIRHAAWIHRSLSQPSSGDDRILQPTSVVRRSFFPLKYERKSHKIRQPTLTADDVTICALLVGLCSMPATNWRTKTSRQPQVEFCTKAGA